MRIMSRCSAKASAVMQAAQDIFDQAFSRECIRLAEEMERCKSPVDAANAQVFGQMEFELISALL